MMSNVHFGINLFGIPITQGVILGNKLILCNFHIDSFYRKRSSFSLCEIYV